MRKFPESSEDEVWVDIPGYEGLYLVSNLGRVWSFERVVVGKSRLGNSIPRLRKARYMNCNFSTSGYLQVGLTDSFGNFRKWFVHRVVATAFLSNEDNYPVVMHKNDDREDNRVVNLKWATQKENTDDMREKGRDSKPPLLRGSMSGMSKLSESDVCKIKELVRGGVDRKTVASTYGITTASVGNIINGKTWRHVE